MVVWEGTRPLLVEIQALVDLFNARMLANPRPRFCRFRAESISDFSGYFASAWWITDLGSRCFC
ncbi:hypothetical protein ARSQ2_01927 [Arsenophonus endosymbiont of Bemisia tabaci Q2]|nr:hypothetical protein ARSQ2_01927 [Arsenophonus endosymbiont of Bemisia tabaci Q2]